MKLGKEKPVKILLSVDSIWPIILLLALVLIAWNVRGILLVVMTSVVFASFIDGITDWLKLKKIPRTPAVMVIYLLTLGLFGGVIYLFVPIFVNEVSSLLALLPKDSNLSELLSVFTNGSVLADPVGTINQIRAIYQESSSGGFFKSTSGFLGSLVNLILILVISFYLAVQEKGIESFLKLVTPHSYEKYAIDVWRRTKRKIGLWFQGQLLLALLIGVLTYLGLLLIGVPYALVLSLFAGVFALVPFGAFVAVVPAVLVAFSAEGLSVMLFSTIGLFVIIQQFENYLFQPLIIQKATGVPSIIVILSLVFGVKLFGFLGLFLSIPAAVLILELLSDYEKIKLAQNLENK